MRPPKTRTRWLTRRCRYCGAAVRVEVIDVLVPAERPDLVERIRKFHPQSAPCACGFRVEVDGAILVFGSADRVWFAPRLGDDDERDLARLLRKADVADTSVRWSLPELLPLALSGMKKERLRTIHDLLVDGFDIPPTERRRGLRLALASVDRSNFPRLWVQLADRLADVEFVLGVHEPEAFERAFRLSHRILEIAERGSFEWLDAHHRIANILIAPGRSEADAAEAERWARQALDALPKRVSPADRAARLEGLFEVLVRRSRFDPRFCQEALDLGRNIVQLWKRTSDRSFVSEALSSLASLLLTATDHRLQNSGLAGRYAREAMAYADRDTEPDIWLKACNLFASAATSRAYQGWEPRMDEAIDLLESALSTGLRKASPSMRALTKSTLAGKYFYRPTGDRTENLERALALYREALRSPHLRSDPEEYGIALLGYGTALSDRLKGDRSENLRAAVRVLRKSLKFEEEIGGQGVEWAYSAMNLAVVLSDITGKRGRGPRIEEAIHLMESAKRWAPTEDDVAFLNNNLGSLYLDRTSGDRGQNARHAIELLRSSAEFYARRSPVMRARALNNLGRAFEVLSESDDEPEKWRREAVKAFRSALRFFEREGYTHDRRGAAKNLFNVEFARGRPLAMRRALETAEAAARDMYLRTESADGRAAEVEENADIYRSLIEVELSIEPRDFCRAFERAEAGRSRLLLDELDFTSLVAPSNLSEETVSREREAFHRVRQAERAVSQEEKRRGVAIHTLRQAKADLVEIWREFDQSEEGRAFVRQRNGTPPSWREAQDWLRARPSGTAFLEYARVPEGFVAFLLKQNEDEPIVDRVELTLSEAKRLVEVADIELHRFRQTGSVGIEWHRIGSPLVASLLPFLDDVEHLFLSVPSELRTIPIHAIAGTEPSLSDRFLVSYVPSLGVAMRLRPRVSAPLRRAAVFGLSASDLPFAEREAESIAARLGTEPRLGDGVTREAVREAFRTCDLVHFAGHGLFDPADPMHSGLACADGRLTARDLIGLDHVPDTVVLSSCVTGKTVERTGDEAYGIGRALSVAGVPRSILSLWNVDDQETERIMTDFYVRLSQGEKSTARALREAALAGRERKHFPYYWAPWFVQGLP